MLIKNGGIYRNIDSKDFLRYEGMGYKAVKSAAEPTAKSGQPAKPKGK